MIGSLFGAPSSLWMVRGRRGEQDESLEITKIDCFAGALRSRGAAVGIPTITPPSLWLTVSPSSTRRTLMIPPTKVT